MMADSYISPMSTPPLSRGSSFQRMLELERQYKFDRLHSTPDLPDLPNSPTSPASPSSAPLSPRLPLQNRRSNSISQQQQDLMLKAARRSAAPPSLSIDIPPPKDDRRTRESKIEQRTQEKRTGPEAEPDFDNVEPLHKSVKFLAPDSDEDESDQSSICQSPSWEEYGQKKKHKKKDAERKRKEKEKKEKAEQEAKAAKKRASRLSKAPPPPIRTMPTVMERSNSAPVLEAHHYTVVAGGPQSSTQDYTRHASPRQDSFRGPLTPEATDVLDSTPKRFVGGLKLQQEREASVQSAAQSQFAYSGATEPRQRMHKSYSTGPGMAMSYQSSSTDSSVRNDSRSSRESLPPSSSRTHMLRHSLPQQGPAPMGRGRDGKQQVTTSSAYSSSNTSQEGLKMAGPSVERGRTQSYVRHQRDQSIERGLTSFADHKVVSSKTGGSSSRSSSQHTRRSSITQEMKAVALKLTGQKPAAGKQPEPLGDGPEDHQQDYFASFDQTHPAAEAEVQPLPSLYQPPKVQAQRQKGQQTKVTQQVSASSNTPSLSSSSASGTMRSLRDVARATLHMGPSTPLQSPVVKPTKPTVKPPPYYMLRAKFSSSSSIPKVTAPTSTPTASQSDKAKIIQTGARVATGSAQPAVRASEGSSSSSNYDDGSPLPSPVTTPDTSRPQSAKGLPVELQAVPLAESENSPVQDDARTIRQSSHALDVDNSSDATPQLEEYEGACDVSPEDRWCQTALPVEIDDTDAKSTVSDYTDAEEEIPAKTISAPANLPKQTTAKTQNSQRFNEPGESFGLPYHLTKQASQPDLLDRGTKKEPLVVSVKADSKAEGRSSSERPSTSPAEKTKQEFQTEDQQEPEQKKRKLRKQLPEAKPEKDTKEDAEVVERTPEDIKFSTALTSTNTNLFSARFMSPIGGFVPSYGFGSNPFFVDFGDAKKNGSTSPDLPVTITATHITVTQTQSAESIQAQSAETIPAQTTIEPAAKPQPLLERPKPTSTPDQQQQQQPPPPLARSSTTPISILKSPPSRPHVLSALPKHLQPSSSSSSSFSSSQLEQPKLAPVAKMFVECCSCKFYHDMPSKLYECMAKPNAVVEDKLRGISGAITTMVKCPWCQHNMSTECCAGYAAVVYLKERLH